MSSRSKNKQPAGDISPGTADQLTTSMPRVAPYCTADAGSYDAALAGDGYGWLGRLLPGPVPLACPRCRRPMRLPTAVRLLWECPTCDPRPEKE